MKPSRLPVLGESLSRLSDDEICDAAIAALCVVVAILIATGVI